MKRAEAVIELESAVNDLAAIEEMRTVVRGLKMQIEEVSRLLEDVHRRVQKRADCLNDFLNGPIPDAANTFIHFLHMQPTWQLACFKPDVSAQPLSLLIERGFVSVHAIEEEGMPGFVNLFLTQAGRDYLARLYRNAEP